MAATPILSLPLTTLSGWTGFSGTWSVDASGFHQASGAATQNRQMYNTPLPQGVFAAQVEIRFDTQPGTAGFTFRTPSATANGSHRVQLSGDGTNITAVGAETDATTAIGTSNLATPIPYGTWATLGVVAGGSAYALYVNGVFQISVSFSTNTFGSYLALANYQAAVSLRNLKVWGPTVPW